eukprot:GHUV01037273.1.p1 GENE.GHUV01037273.1~~GHUV01037273.1.p1  ORF type:complete len:166 (+),score=51.97 GHUV01037273.1:470-967(+)
MSMYDPRSLPRTAGAHITSAPVLPHCNKSPCLLLQITGMLDTIKTATAAPINAAENKVHKQNEGFLQDEGSKQQMMLKQQDAHLDDIEAAVTRLGRVGLTIHEELESQGNMLDELEEDVDTTHSRLRATQKKIMDVIKKSGTTTQLGLIAFLMIVLVLLSVWAFM